MLEKLSKGALRYWRSLDYDVGVGREVYSVYLLDETMKAIFYSSDILEIEKFILEHARLRGKIK